MHSPVSECARTSGGLDLAEHEVAVVAAHLVGRALRDLLDRRVHLQLQRRVRVVGAVHLEDVCSGKTQRVRTEAHPRVGSPRNMEPWTSVGQGTLREPGVPNFAGPYLEA